MIGVRWQFKYNFSLFLRNKEWSEYYRKVEVEEHSRDIPAGQHVLVEGLLNEALKIPIGNPYYYYYFC